MNDHDVICNDSNGVVIDLQDHFKTYTNFQNLPKISTKIYNNVLDFGQLRAVEFHPRSAQLFLVFLGTGSAPANKNPQPHSDANSVSHILNPDKPSDAAGSAPPPRPSAPPYHASASSAFRNLSEFVGGNSNWYTNPLDVWSKAEGGAAGGRAVGGSGKTVQFAAGTEHVGNVR